MTAPVTSGVSFFLPAWFGDRSVPRSAIAAYAEGAIRIEARMFTEGDTTEPELELPVESRGRERVSPAAGLGHSPVAATASRPPRRSRHTRCCSAATWRCGSMTANASARSTRTSQPVSASPIPKCQPSEPGTYLLLRQGETERGALYQAAIAKLGQRGERSRCLPGRHGSTCWPKDPESSATAGRAGVAGRGRPDRRPGAGLDGSQPDPPSSDQDFERLLQWLGIPIQPTFGYAAMLRKMLYQVSAEIGKQLEAAVSAADLSELETTGHLSLDVKTEGFREFWLPASWRFRPTPRSCRGTMQGCRLKIGVGSGSNDACLLPGRCRPGRAGTIPGAGRRAGD